MANHPCELCSLSFPSISMLTLHQLAEHRVYRDYSQIASTIQQRIGILKVQVLMELYHHPGTRGDDDLLLNWHQVDYQGIKEFRDGEFRELQGLTHRQIHTRVKAGSLGRLRRFVQADDRAMYHAHYVDGNGKVVYTPEALIPHECCLPSVQTQLRRKVEAEESRRTYGAMASQREGRGLIEPMNR